MAMSSSRDWCVNLRTQEDYDAFMFWCERNGLMWCGNRPALYQNNWINYGPDTCVSYSDGELGYCNISYYMTRFMIERPRDIMERFDGVYRGYNRKPTRDPLMEEYTTGFHREHEQSMKSKRSANDTMMIVDELSEMPKEKKKEEKKTVIDLLGKTRRKKIVLDSNL